MGDAFSDNEKSAKIEENERTRLRAAFVALIGYFADPSPENAELLARAAQSAKLPPQLVETTEKTAILQAMKTYAWIDRLQSGDRGEWARLLRTLIADPGMSFDLLWDVQKFSPFADCALVNITDLTERGKGTYELRGQVNDLRAELGRRGAYTWSASPETDVTFVAWPRKREPSVEAPSDNDDVAQRGDEGEVRQVQILRSIYFPEELLASLNERAHFEGTALANLVRMYVVEGLAKPAQRPGPKPEKHPQFRLRMFKVPDELYLRMANRRVHNHDTASESVNDILTDQLKQTMLTLTSKEVAFHGHDQNLVLRSYYLTVAVDDALTAFAKSAGLTKGQVFRAFVARAIGVRG